MNYPKGFVAGDEIVVRFGSNGTQLALVVKDEGGAEVTVQKWLDNGRKWTGNVKVLRGAILGFANGFGGGLGYSPATLMRARQAREVRS